MLRGGRIRHFRYLIFNETVDWSVPRYPKVKEVSSVCCIEKKEKKILSMVEKIRVCTSCVFGTIIVETRRGSNVKRRDEGVYAVLCIGMGVANLLSERCCKKYCS